MNASTTRMVQVCSGTVACNLRRALDPDTMVYDKELVRDVSMFEDLFVYLQQTQPPQRPGALSDAEYWALTAFLLHENDRLLPGVQIGPDAAGRTEARGDAVVTATLGLLLAMLLGLWGGRRWRR